MASDPAIPAPEDDEALAEFIADQVVERALLEDGPIRLAALQMAGLVPPPLPPVPLSQEAAAAAFGMSRKRLRKIEAKALGRVRHRIGISSPFEAQVPPASEKP